MIFFLILLLISVGALTMLLAKNFLSLKSLPKEEILSRFNSAKPFWNDFNDLLVAPTVRVHQEKVRLATYKEIEKLVRRFRIIVLRIECLLLRFSEYIRGKRVMPSNGHKSHYWEQLNNCKNGANFREKNMPE
jgi:hypothetical protein